MLTTPATPAMIAEWQSVFKAYQSRLAPNRKSVDQVIAYLAEKYPLTALDTAAALAVVTGNITGNRPFAEKCPAGRPLQPLVFTIPRQGGGALLYAQREAFYGDTPIMVGLEHETAFVMVEGSGELADELVAFAGLDEVDLNNYYLVANYIACMEKFNLIDQIIPIPK
ncbi:hypothetical protein [Acetobacterium sp.]|uniref:hypothetical protein n=1 Tax=Acetobacterium sp. TaxID=1872094 RepID=UPI000CC955C8|nr:hypothetical protein [Acetobacterium sp.]MDO9492575.1 hypothetical protein [Acetobacterium sp.]PKM73668.1 MAG: hypothetical protein CVU92_06435 [Firmicutes bacterium HGW-Firmicutes-17]